MPISLDNSGPVVWITASDAVTYSEILELFAAMLRKAPRVGRLPVFVDTRKVSEAPSTAELRLIGRELKHLSDAGFGPIGVLTGSTWMYGVTRMFSVFAQSATDVVALSSIEDATAWIDNYAMSATLDKRPPAKLPDSFLQLRLGFYHDRDVPRDRPLNRIP
jgi:hypothetical protein